VPQRGDAGPVMLLQRVQEAKSGKNRMHLDLHPTQPAAFIAELEAIGATRVGDVNRELVDIADASFQVMADPEGNEFCVIWHSALPDLD
jgi:Glyoxalase-like domain